MRNLLPTIGVYLVTVYPLYPLASPIPDTRVAAPKFSYSFQIHMQMQLHSRVDSINRILHTRYALVVTFVLAQKNDFSSKISLVMWEKL